MSFIIPVSKARNTHQLHSLCVDVVEAQLPMSDPWKISFSVGYHNAHIEIDTRVQCNIIISNEQGCRFTDIRKLKDKNVLTGFGGEKMKSLGIAELNVNHRGQNYILKCEVVNRNMSNIIEQTDNPISCIVKRVYSVKNDNIISGNIEEILSAANDVFDNLGCAIGVRVLLKLRPNIPPSVHPPRSVPVAIGDLSKQEIERLIDLKYWLLLSNLLIMLEVLLLWTNLIKPDL